MRMKSWILALALCLAPMMAMAQTAQNVVPGYNGSTACFVPNPTGTPSSPTTVKSGQYISTGAYQSLSSLSSAAPITIVYTGSLGAQMCNEGTALRYTDDGTTTPTASVGMPIAAGSATNPYCFSYFGPLANFKVIQQASGGGPLDVLLYK
jgi:hypothetical protein